MISKVHTVYRHFFRGGVHYSYRTTVQFYLSDDLNERVSLINIGIKIDLLC